MHAIVRTLRTQWLGALGLLVGVTGVAFGATGQPALLGKLNQANQTTTIQNTLTGPALALKVKPGQPPLVVNSNVQVPGLNASRLGGKLPAALRGCRHELPEDGVRQSVRPENRQHSLRCRRLQLPEDGVRREVYRHHGDRQLLHEGPGEHHLCAGVGQRELRQGWFAHAVDCQLQPSDSPG